MTRPEQVKKDYLKGGAYNNINGPELHIKGPCFYLSYLISF
jgi:hypothetical protein